MCAIISKVWETSMSEIFVDSLYDAILDCLKVMPILFIAYLLVSLLSHDHSHKFSKFLAKNRKTSVFYASFLGCVPQCGFSSVIADLYSERHVSLGALIAVFVATSDEAIPIMVSDSAVWENPTRLLDLLKLLGIKVVLAIFWGYLIELLIKAIYRKKNVPFVAEEIPAHNHSHDHRHECGHIHSHECDADCGHAHGSCCADNIFLDAFGHTFSILIYIFVATFAINMIVGTFGTEALENLLTSNLYVQIVVASLIGLIPNCASSVLLVELFLAGSLGFPALLAGLTSGAGVGIFILFSRNRRHMLKNFGILFLQYAIGVVSGLIVSLFL